MPSVKEQLVALATLGGRIRILGRIVASIPWWAVVRRWSSSMNYIALSA